MSPERASVPLPLKLDIEPDHLTPDATVGYWVRLNGSLVGYRPPSLASRAEVEEEVTAALARLLRAVLAWKTSP